MSETLDALTLDLLQWIEKRPRPYREVMDAWRTSCPALPVWEHVCDSGFVVRRDRQGSGIIVSLTPAGRAYLARQRRARPAAVTPPAVPVC